MIIMGFPGIGKTTLCQKSEQIGHKWHKQLIDLESSVFLHTDKEEITEEQAKKYVQLALHLSRHGYHVFISTHPIVYETVEKLIAKPYEALAIYPDLSLKKEWLQRLEDRYMQTRHSKDLRAWSTMVNIYDDAVSKLNSPDYRFMCRVITSMDYNLATILDDDLDCSQHLIVIRNYKKENDNDQN